MKKILSFLLAALMLVSMVPTALAADVDVSEGTTIKVVGTGADTYTVTVPAKLAPGESGTVKANGTWPSNQTLNVTAPSSVTLTHGTQTMDVGITFDGIHQAGNDTGSVSAEQTVAVAAASALFGTWTGTLTYTVEMVTVETEVELVNFTFNGEAYSMPLGSTWGDFLESSNNDGSFSKVDGYERVYWVEDDGDKLYVTSLDGDHEQWAYAYDVIYARDYWAGQPVME